MAKFLREFLGDTIPAFFRRREIEKEVRRISRHPYKVYVALLSQGGTDTPEVIVLQNSIGNIVWTRNSAGTYTGTLVGAFPANETWVIIQNPVVADTETAIERGDDDSIGITTRNSSSALTDSILNMTSVEIRVYG